MAVHILDLRQQSERCSLNNTTEDEIRYAEAFWHSVRLQPTMESRLVSSDIKQRLGKKVSHGKPGASTGKSAAGSELDIRLNEFFVRARTLDQVERFQRLQKLAEARDQDRELLHKHREERIKKEKISRGFTHTPIRSEELQQVQAEVRRKIGEAYGIEEMLKDIDEFERKKREGKHYEVRQDKYKEALNKKLQTDPEITILVKAMKK